MAYINVPDKATTYEETLAVSTGRNKGKEVKREFIANMPEVPMNGENQRDFNAGLGNAVALLGAKKVFRLFINAYVVELQNAERQELQPEVEGKGRKKAPYLASLGF